MTRTEFSRLVRIAEFKVAGYLPGTVHPAYRNTPVLDGITGINVGMKGITNAKMQQINAWHTRQPMARKPNPYRFVRRTPNPTWAQRLGKLAMTKVF